MRNISKTIVNSDLATSKYPKPAETFLAPKCALTSELLSSINKMRFGNYQDIYLRVTIRPAQHRARESLGVPVR